MSDARSEILGRLRRALDDAPTTPAVPRGYRRTSQRGHAEVVDMLEDRLLDYKATVIRETTETVADRIAELVGDYVVPAGLERSWLPRGGAGATDTADAVVTSSTVSCAETGTIFLSARPEEGRRVLSLVPDHHVCIVPLDSVVELLPEAFERLEPTAPITMISGPSATSDIELERVEGVHGPRRLDVILLG